MSTTLYRGGAVLTPDVLAARPDRPPRRGPVPEDLLEDAPTALLVVDGAIAWIGREDEADGLGDAADAVVRLDGALVTPGFVDAHVHLLDAGLRRGSVDLSGARDLAAALAAVRDAATGEPGRAAAVAGSPLCGYGWDDDRWPEGRPPTRAELDAAAGGAPVLLVRADLAAGVVSTSFAEVLGLRALAGWREDGLVTGAAHVAARRATLDVAADRRDALHADALAAAARSGVVAVHEQSVPHLDSRAGLAALLARTATPASGLPLVVGYRAELCETADDARALAAAVPGLAGLGGVVDGALGSRTAALRAAYADAAAADPGARGALELTAEQVSNQVTAASRAGLQAVFRAVGDRAVDEVLLGFRVASDVEGIDAVRTGGHRLERASMLDATALATLVLLGLTVSAQPGLDAAWGGDDGAYARRIGAGRAASLHPLADLRAAGVPLALGSGSPTTSGSPWAAVRAAAWHRTPDQRIAVRDAVAAHTRGGWLAAGSTSRAGLLEVGAPAHLAVWRDADDARPASLPTGRTALPGSAADAPDPRCVRTVRAGEVLHDELG